jgi:hypothetical protein
MSAVSAHPQGTMPLSRKLLCGVYAAIAVPVLAAASDLTCEHAARPSKILDALVA